MNPWSMSSNSGCPILLPSATTNRYRCARSSTSERAIDISKLIDAVRTGPSEHSPGPRPELLVAAADSSNRIDNHVRATTSNTASG